MKHSIKDAKRLSSIAIMFLAVGAVGFSMTPDSFAMNTPSASTLPQIVVVGITQITLVIDGDGVGNNNAKIRVYSPNHPVLSPVSMNPCGLAPVAATFIGYDLVLVGTSTPYIFTLTLDTDGIRVPFGGAGAFFVTLIGAPTDNAAGGMVEWKEVVSGLTNTDAISQVVGDVHRYNICGFDTGQTLQFNVLNNWSIQAPVGGSILAIDTTALLIAGVFSTGFWMIPAAAAGISAGLALYKIRRNH